MSPTIKNALIFISIGAVLILIYVYFIKGSPEDGVQNLVTSTTTPLAGAVTPGSTSSPAAAGELLSLLLSVNNIKLNDAIFSDPSFQSLKDSSILLVPDGTEGRPNPFAPLGQDQIVSGSADISNETLSTTPNENSTAPSAVTAPVDPKPTGTTTTTTPKTQTSTTPKKN